MRALILGGTVFLGRHVADEALARGHELTLFTRGVHGVIDGAEHLRGDRTGDLSVLEGRQWDVVIDTSGYEAEPVARSSGALAGSGAHLVFVSSCNVYPAWPAEPVDEDSPVWESGDDYGQQKAAAERAADAALPGRVAAVRAGLICGPNDNVFRLMELPLWLPEAEFPGTWQIGTERAQASGLRCRPIAETVVDVWAWLREGGEAELDEWRSEHRPRPMSSQCEHELFRVAAATVPRN